MGLFVPHIRVPGNMKAKLQTREWIKNHQEIVRGYRKKYGNRYNKTGSTKLAQKKYKAKYRLTQKCRDYMREYMRRYRHSALAS